MTEQDLIQSRLRELEDRRSNIMWMIADLETKKSAILKDYWAIQDEIVELLGKLQKCPEHNKCAVGKCEVTE